jgi:hypothetical protein
MDNLYVRLNFNLSKEKGIKHQAKKNIMRLVKLQNLVAKKSLENIALQSLQILYMFVLRAEIVTIFGRKMVTISARNTNIYKMCKLRKAIFSVQHFVTKFCNFTNFLISSLREFTFFA